HEISNPLAIVTAYAQRARRTIDPIEQAKLSDSLDVIIDESFRAKRIIQQLLQLTRSKSPDRLVINLADLVRNYVETFAKLPEAERVHLRVAIEPALDATIRADADELRQVLANLLTNSIRATADVEYPLITVRIEPRQQMLLLSVTDNGIGLDQPTITRAFEPFFTRSKSGDSPGVGLGLAITRSIVESLGGVIEIHSAGPREGASVVVALPTAASIEKDGQVVVS
ncbi:MAG TPA: HAMP domain-containing sensor histidine kinase, partial [Tepidisphaeraceae bacterium]|nr:HAMP domain-containing sensor histidine kinase [Tepidisphaeraceae bacterium]